MLALMNEKRGVVGEIIIEILEDITMFFREFADRQRGLFDEVSKKMRSLPGSFYYWFLHGFLARVLKKACVVEITGKENIPVGDSFIVAANHSSYIDFLFVMSVLPGKIYFFVKPQYFDSRLWHHFIREMGHIRADRKGLEQGLRMLASGAPVAIHPEGTRSKTGKLGRGKLGIIKLSMASGKKVLPLAIKNTNLVWPPGEKYPKFKKVVRLRFCQQLDPAKYGEEKKHFLDDIMSSLQKKLEN